MHHLLFILHLLSATVWTGGHIVLALSLLPAALRQNDPGIIIAFEKKYERIGIPSLLILVITGIMMAYRYGVTVSVWFSFREPVEQIVSAKLMLLFLIFALAVHARFFIIPTLNEKSLVKMAVHIVLITIVSVLMLVLGTMIRFGGL
jgi:putative copper export protein